MKGVAETILWLKSSWFFITLCYTYSIPNVEFKQVSCYTTCFTSSHLSQVKVEMVVPHCLQRSSLRMQVLDPWIRRLTPSFFSSSWIIIELLMEKPTTREEFCHELGFSQKKTRDQFHYDFSTPFWWEVWCDRNLLRYHHVNLDPSHNMSSWTPSKRIPPP